MNYKLFFSTVITISIVALTYNTHTIAQVATCEIFAPSSVAKGEVFNVTCLRIIGAPPGTWKVTAIPKRYNGTLLKKHKRIAQHTLTIPTNQVSFQLRIPTMSEIKNGPLKLICKIPGGMKCTKTILLSD